VAYWIINGVLGAIAYALLLQSTDVAGWAAQTGLAVSAGLGAAAIIRARVLTVRVNEQDVAIGPGVTVDQFLKALDREIDRRRALDRTATVRDVMEGVDFGLAAPYLTTLVLGSRQNLNAADQQRFKSSVEAIAESPEGTHRSYALGFLILDYMGERYLRDAIAKAETQPVDDAVDPATERAWAVREIARTRAAAEIVAVAQNIIDDPTVSDERKVVLRAKIEEVGAQDTPESRSDLAFAIWDVVESKPAFDRLF
jgi:hypothetical protein